MKLEQTVRLEVLRLVLAETRPVDAEFALRQAKPMADWVLGRAPARSSGSRRTR